MFSKIGIRYRCRTLVAKGRVNIVRNISLAREMTSWASSWDMRTEESETKRQLSERERAETDR